MATFKKKDADTIEKIESVEKKTMFNVRVLEKRKTELESELKEINDILKHK